MNKYNEYRIKAQFLDKLLDILTSDHINVYTLENVPNLNFPVGKRKKRIRILNEGETLSNPVDNKRKVIEIISW